MVDFDELHGSGRIGPFPQTNQFPIPTLPQAEPTSQGKSILQRLHEIEERTRGDFQQLSEAFQVLNERLSRVEKLLGL